MKKEKKTTAKERANTSVGSRFPHLSASTHLESDIREDFLLTEREFGDKYRRGKQARLQEFENAENRMAVQFLTAQVERMSPIVEAIQRCAVQPRLCWMQLSELQSMSKKQKQYMVWLLLIFNAR